MSETWDPFWLGAFQTEFVPELQAIVDTLESRLLPTIERGDIEEESSRIEDEAFERYMSMPGTGEEDPSCLADRAARAGISHYILMSGIRQGMLNLFTAALYHAFEQQIMFFHRKNVLCKEEEDESGKLRLSEFQSRLKECGIDITEFYSWPKIDELRLAANTAKHAEGGSSDRLREIRPDMFRNPCLSGLSEAMSGAASQVFQPLVGEGLYVSVQDIGDYRDHLVRFWLELAEAMKCT